MPNDDDNEPTPPAESPPPLDLTALDPEAEIVVHADGRVTTEGAAAGALDLGEARRNADGELTAGVVTMASPHAPIVMGPHAPAVGPLSGGSQVREVGRATPALSLIIGGAAAPAVERTAELAWSERIGRIRELIARRQPDLSWRAREEARTLRLEIEAAGGHAAIVDLCLRAERGRL